MIILHEDADFFREAVLFTARNTGMNADLVERDYFFSLLLSHLFQDPETPVVFRGGTSLSKIYADFYRLSDDLDFVISTPTSATRKERSRRIEPFKEWLRTITAEDCVFQLSEEMRGYNNSTQYIGYITYTSVANITTEPGRIKIEVGLREELLNSPVTGEARTLLTDPFRNEPAVSNIPVKTLTLMEAYAEKLRAALTRREVAIRDFYDIYYAVTNLRLDLNDPTLEKYVLLKLRVPYNEPIDTSLSRQTQLRSQLKTQLRPVLRAKDYESFDLDTAFDLVADFGAKMEQYI
jgi:predicted nucleotidyltransferase component of viral defense system